MAKRSLFREVATNPEKKVHAAQPVAMSGQEAWVDTLIGLNDHASNFLDRKASLEGAKEGAAKGGQKDSEGNLTFRSMPSHTIKGRAFNAAGEIGYKSALEAGLRGKARDLFNDNKHDPKGYSDAFDSYYRGIKGGIEENNPEFVGVADAIFENVKRPYMEESIKFADKRLKEQSIASLRDNIEARNTDTQMDIRHSDDVEGAMVRSTHTRGMLVSDLMKSGPRAAIDRDVFTELSDEEFESLKIGEESDSRTEALSVDQIKDVINAYDTSVQESVALRGLDDAMSAGEGKAYASDFISKNIKGVGSEDKERINKSVMSHLRRVTALNAGERQRQDDIASQQRALKASNLTLATNRGQGSRESIDSAFESRTITGPHRTKLHLMMDAADAKRTADSESVELVSGALLSGDPLDWKNKDHQKAVETFYNKAFTGADPFSDEVMSSVVSIASTTTIIPKQVAAQIRAHARSTDPLKAMKSVEYVSRLRESAAQSLEVIPENEKAFSMMVSESVRAGMDEMQAVEQAQGLVYGTPENERKVVEAEINNKDFRTESINSLNEFIDDRWDSVSETQPLPSSAMLADYNSLVKSYYTRTRDVDLARNLATDDIQNEWGVSRLNGGLQLMRRPPELMYGDGNESEWMNDQLADIKFSLGIHEDQRMIVVSDDNTARGQKPTYSLWQVDENGLESPIITPNGPARWVPDFAASRQFVQQAKDAQKAISEAKKERLRIEATRERKRGIMPPETLIKGLGDDPLAQELFLDDVIKNGKSTQSPEQQDRQSKIIEGLV